MTVSGSSPDGVSTSQPFRWQLQCLHKVFQALKLNLQLAPLRIVVPDELWVHRRPLERALDHDDLRRELADVGLDFSGVAAVSKLREPSHHDQAHAIDCWRPPRAFDSAAGGASMASSTRSRCLRPPFITSGEASAKMA